MASIAITESEILAALSSATGDGPENARTTVEIVDVTGLSRRTVTDALRALFRQGRLVVHPVKRMSFDGKTRPVSAYTILPPPKKGAKK